MKKLIALATVFAIGGAFAACELPPTEAAWVYKWKFTGKTTVGKPISAKESKVSNACNLPSGNGGDSGACGLAVRVPASLKIEGYTWICLPNCGSDDFEKFVELNEIFWQKKPFKASLSGGVSTDVSNIIGKKAKQFEAAGVASFTAYAAPHPADPTTGNDQGVYTLTYAGLGKYDLKHSRVKSVSGNFAGFLSSPYYIGKIGEEWCPPAGFWDCPTVSTLLCGPSVAYGKWSAKYQKSASKKFLKNGKLPKKPTWARQLNLLAE